MPSSTVWKNNPYIIGTPIRQPERFFGREALFAFIQDVLSERAKVILLHGQRRIGKSSVLRQIPNFVHLDAFVFVPFDLQDQTRLPLDHVLHTLAKEILERLELPRDKVVLPTREELQKDPYVFAGNFLPQVYETLGDKNLVLLLDEFDALRDYSGDAAVEHFFPYLQSIIYRQERLFVIPVVGRRLDEMQNLLSLFSGAPYREIGLLDEDSAKRLIIKPAEGVLKYSPDAIEAILELSSGHPYFTQLICHALFARARDKQAPTVTRTDVEEIVDKAIESGEAGLVWFRDGLPIPERVIFSAVAEVEDKLKRERAKDANTTEPLLQRLIKAFTGNAGEVIYSTKWSSGWGGHATGAIWKVLEELGVVQTETLRQAENNLIQWGYLREMKRSEVLIAQVYAYEVTIDLVRRWLVVRHPLRGEIRELEYVDAIVGPPIFVDGKMGSQTRRAILSFQQRQGLPADGVLGPETEQALIAAGASPPSDINRQRPAYIRWVQSALNALNSVHPIYEEAVEARGGGDLQKAVQLYELILEANPNHFRALFEMAEACLEVEAFGKAVELYMRAYRVDPMRTQEGFVQSLLSYGRDLTLQGQFEPAKQTFTQLLEVEPDNALAQQRLQELKDGIPLEETPKEQVQQTIDTLSQQMREAAAALKFEEAAMLRDKIEKLKTMERR